jgi:hypothetical protein
MMVHFELWGLELSKQLKIVCEKSQMNLANISWGDLVYVGQFMLLIPKDTPFPRRSQQDLVERLHSLQTYIFGCIVEI